jgi:hypothetical protein
MWHTGADQDIVDGFSQGFSALFVALSFRVDIAEEGAFQSNISVLSM